ncbi:phage tail terminator-like protein [Pacificimonas sp. ICDLI1SI03]
MTIAQDAAALTSRFRTEWQSRHSGMVILWDNAPAVAVSDTHVRFSVRPGDYDPDGYLTGQGRVWVQIMTPDDGGMTEGNTLADDVAEIFRRWRSPDGAVQTGGADINTVPDDPNWHVIAVSIPYHSWRTL